MVVLDPAKQTRDREEVDFALKRYLDMNRLALQAVAPGGMFLTCSCTGLVTRRLPRIGSPGGVAGGARTCRSCASPGPGPIIPTCCMCPKDAISRRFFAASSDRCARAPRGGRGGRRAAAIPGFGLTESGKRATDG